MSSTDELKIKARFLRNAAPRAYDEFVDAFAAYTHNATGTLLAADTNWQLYQGHAQQCVKILNTLQEAKDG